ncbi:MAG: hypothetical protein LBN25_03185 [Christensenellaceae bacterium]|jgi:hypothetical protein|nr:hypothetical protein [Christensenellaceae bacterium]
MYRIIYKFSVIFKVKKILATVLAVIALSLGVFALASCKKDEVIPEVDTIKIEFIDEKVQYVTEGNLFAADIFKITATLTDGTTMEIPVTNTALVFDKKELELDKAGKYVKPADADKKVKLTVTYLSYRSASIEIEVKKA